MKAIDWIKGWFRTFDDREDSKEHDLIVFNSKNRKPIFNDPNIINQIADEYESRRSDIEGLN